MLNFEPHLPGKFVLTQGEHLSSDSVDNFTLVLHTAMLQNVLNDIVTILVHHQPLCILMELIQHGLGLIHSAVLQNALDDTTTVGVGRQTVHLHKREMRTKVKQCLKIKMTLAATRGNFFQ